MASKPKSTAILLNLPEEQQAQLAQWMLNGMPYHQCKTLVEKEFGITVKSLGTFSEFWDVVCNPQLMAKRRRVVETSKQFAEETENNQALDAAFVSMLKQKAVEVCQKPSADPDEVNAVLGQVLKLRDQELKQIDLAQKRDAFEWDASAECLKQLPALKSIAANPTLDNNGKINAIRAKLFGQLPEVKP